MSDFDKTCFTTDQISKWIWFVKKTDFDECFACRKSFLEHFITQNPNFCSYVLSQKPWYGEKMDKNQFVIEDFWRESDFETTF